MEQKTKISIQGGDAATREQNNTPQSRLWWFPDGLRRIITLPAIYWQFFDDLDEAGRIDDFCTEVFYTAIETQPVAIASNELGTDDFEFYLRLTIKRSIITHKLLHDEDNLVVANDVLADDTFIPFGYLKNAFDVACCDPDTQPGSDT